MIQPYGINMHNLAQMNWQETRYEVFGIQYKYFQPQIWIKHQRTPRLRKEYYQIKGLGMGCFGTYAFSLGKHLIFLFQTGFFGVMGATCVRSCNISISPKPKRPRTRWFGAKWAYLNLINLFMELNFLTPSSQTYGP